MNNLLYSRLGINNIKKNKSTYFPYMLSSTVMIALFYILHAITEQAKLGNFYGDRSMITVLNLGVYIAGGFSVIFIYYANSFLIKRRKKELGLYSILGMEKKHIGKVLFFEVLYSGGISLVIGILAGILFGRLMFALLLNLLNLSTSIKFNIPLISIGVTIILFILTYSVVMISNLRQIHTNNPLDLMKSNKEGEKEPRANWIIAILGIISLGIGYYLALAVKNPIQSFGTFFVAVMFVMVATYFLFTAGSISLLKVLKKNKKFYYNKKHFIPVSNMMYRMKQNAVGLGNICILSTAVLLTLSTTVSLYIGFEDIMRQRFPKDIQFEYIYEGQDREVALDTITRHGERYNIEIKDLKEYFNLSVASKKIENQIIEEKAIAESSWADLYDVTFVTLSDYNMNTGKNEELSNGEVLVWVDGEEFNHEILEFYNHKFRVKKQIDRIPFINGVNYISSINIVVPDIETLEELYETINKDSKWENSIYRSYNFDIEGDLSNKKEFSLTLRSALNESVERIGSIDNIYTQRQDFLSIFGSLLFIGLFLGTFFMIATVLSIYYKQISEGYEDQHRFDIMQKVGMSKVEVKSTINNQVKMVFFLPLITAIIHILFAFPMVSKILAILDMTNTKLFLSFTGIVILIFACAYFAVYKLTARTYYKIVN